MPNRSFARKPRPRGARTGRRAVPAALIAAALIAAAVVACGREPGRDLARPGAAGSSSDSAFVAVQARGGVAMGVDQYTSHHRFDPLADGGRITLERDAADSAGADRIRQHMAEIARRFAAGDFGLPGFVHARDIPGTAVMAAKRSAISYAVESLPQGAALRVRTTDPAAVAAIHEFLQVQRHDHHVATHSDS